MKNNKLANYRGEIMLKQTILKYSSIILKEIEENPQILSSILEQLELDEEEFFDYLVLNPITNIVFYDETLRIINKLSKKKNKNLEKRLEEDD